MATSEEKRLKSLTDKKIDYKRKLSTVQKALSSIDAVPNKKIIFNENDEIENEPYFTPRKKQKLLFVQDEEEIGFENDFAVKEQFEGRKGQKLLELQSRFTNDKRFTLDERFVEDVENVENTNIESEETLENEKKRERAILASVIGKTIPDRKQQTASIGMLRFDPSRPDHSKFEVTETLNSVQKDETNRNKKEQIVVTETEQINTVTSDMFYKVTDTLKQSLEQKSSFSLLNMFGKRDNDQHESVEEQYTTQKISKRKQIGESRNPFRYDSSDSEDETKSTVPKTHPCPPVKQTPSGVWREKFFFTENDERFKEGLNFILELRDAVSHDTFAATRREMKKIIRAKVRNNKRNIQPFKKKLGGRKTHFKRNK